MNTQKHSRSVWLMIAVASLVACLAGSAVVGAGAMALARIKLTANKSIASAPTQTLAPSTTLSDPQATAAPATTAITISPTVTSQPTRTPTATPIPQSKVTSATTARQQKVFDALWKTVNDKYVYADFNGRNWNEVKSLVAAQIQSGMTDDDFYDLIRDTIDSLNDEHSSFLSPADRKIEEEQFAGTNSYVGIGVFTEFDEAHKVIYVSQVVPNSPADKAGIRAHDILLAANGVLLVDANGEPNTRVMRGADGSAVTITVQSPNAAPTNIIMRREKVANSAIVESRMLPSAGGKKIGYLLLPTFYEQQLSRKTRTALTTLMQNNNNKLDGLVIDMRNNGGGEFDILSSNLGFFTSGNVGAFVNRTGISETVTVRAERIGNSQSVPLVILTSGNTASFAEVFTGVLQYKRGAKLVGQNSMGNIEILRPHEFDDGSQLWLAEQAFRLPNGTSWEGVGLKPDISINKMFYEFTTENDPAITAAIDLLSK